MASRDKRPLGPFRVEPVGLGAMRLSGPGIFGPPRDRDEAIALLREAVHHGVDHIDTAAYYGPDVVNQLIREALHPYPPELVLVSNVGARRDERGGIFAFDEPKQLRHGIEENLRTLGVDFVPVVNLRLMRAGPPDGFFDDQLAAMLSAREDGLISAVGLSNVTVAHLLRALEFTEIACVQNAYHLGDRRSQPVLNECVRRGIAFVPFAPLGSGSEGSIIAAPQVMRIAARVGAPPAEVALAWILHAAPNTLLIPGTSSRLHLRQNLAAAGLKLDDEAMRELSPSEPQPLYRDRSPHDTHNWR
jgi:pyridoxine 4-dehydrogenase